MASAKRGVSPRDYFEQNETEQVNQIEKSIRRVKEGTKGMLVAFVLVTTITFVVAFTVPGGYRVDGSPAFAEKFSFKMVVDVDVLAFIFSMTANFFLILPRQPMLDPTRHGWYMKRAYYTLVFSVTCMVMPLDLVSI